MILLESVIKHPKMWLTRNDNRHIGNTPDDVEDELHKYYNHFNIPNFGSVINHTKGSGEFNHALLNAHMASEEPHFIHRAIAEQLDVATHHKPLNTHLHVYHGCTFNPGELAKSHKENRIFFPGFLSTTVDKRISHYSMFSEPQEVSGEDKPTKHIIHFHLTPGQHGVYVGKHSHYNHEKEFLMPRNISAKISNRPNVYEDEFAKTKIWHATDIQNHNEEIKEQLKKDQ